MYLTVAGQRTTPGLELVSFSRVKNPEDIAVGNPVDELAIANITNIGNTPAYKTKKYFGTMLKEKDFASQQPTIDAIIQLDATVLGGKSYEGGCEFLLEWFNDKVCVNVA